MEDSECVVIDGALDGFVLTKSESGSDLIIDRVVLDENLLDRLIDHDADAMSVLRRLIS